MAKKNTPPEDEIFDLTELIEEGGKPARAGAAAYARQAATPPAEETDFEAALAQASGGNAPGMGNAEFNPDEQLDLSALDDIDNIIESLQIPSQPERRPAPEKPDGAPAADALDNVLDMLGGAENEGQASPAPAPASAQDADLDDLLSSFDEPTPKKPAPSKAPKPAAAPDLDADLDDILFATDAQAPKKPAPSKAPKPAAAPDLDADLDDILFATDEPAPKKTTPTKATEPAAAPDLDADLDEILGNAPKNKSAGEASSVDEKVAPSPQASADDLDLPDNLGDLLTDARPEAAPAQPEKAPGAEIAQFQEQASAPELPHTTARLVAPELSQEMVANICQGLLAGHMGSVQDTLQKLSLEMGSQTAHLEDLGRTVTDLSRRLFATESKLSAARAKIASLEKSLASISSLDDLFKDGTSLHEGFLNMLGSTVGHAVQGVMAQIQAAGVQPAQLQTLAHMQEDVDGRLVQLESRLDQLEPALTARMDVVENGAARIAARLETGTVDASLAGRIDNLEQELAALKESSQGDLSMQVDSIQKQLDELGPQLIARLDQAEAQASETAANFEARLGQDASAADLESLSSRMDDLAQTLEDRLTKLEAASNADSGLEAQFAEMQAKIDALAPEFDKRAAQTEAGLSEKLDSLEAKFGQDASAADLESLSSRMDDLAQELEDRLTKLETASKADVGLEAQLAEMQAKIDALAPEFDKRAAQTEAGLSEKLDSLEAKLGQDASAADLESLSSRMDDLAQALEDRLTKLEVASNADSGLEVQFAEMQAKIDALAPEFDKRAAQTEAGLSEKLESLEAKLGQDASAADLESLSSRMDDLAQALEDRLTKLEAASNADAGLEAQLAAIQEKIAALGDNGLRDADLEANLAAMQQKMDALVPEFAKRFAQAEGSMAEKLSALEAKLGQDASVADLESLSSRIDGLGKALEDRIARLKVEDGQNLEARLAAMQGQIDEFISLGARLGQAEASLAAMAASSGSAEMGELAGRLEQTEEASGAMGKKIAKLSSLGQSVNARVDSLEIRLDKLEPNFNIQIEKAAAATVARILNEEIRRLAGGAK